MGAGREWQRTRFLPGEVRVRAPPHPPIFACVTGTKKTSTAQTCRLGGASPPAGTRAPGGKADTPALEAGAERHAGAIPAGPTNLVPVLGTGRRLRLKPGWPASAGAGSNPAGDTKYSRRWRNWQTHQAQDLARLHSWRFNSSPAHQSSPDGSDGQDASPTQRNTWFDSTVGHQYSGAWWNW